MRGREWGSVAAALRLNDVFQEEQSSLSNRRLRNELAYLLGSARGCRAMAFHIPSIRPNNAIVREIVTENERVEPVRRELWWREE